MSLIFLRIKIRIKIPHIVTVYTTYCHGQRDGDVLYNSVLQHQQRQLDLPEGQDKRNSPSGKVAWSVHHNTNLSGWVPSSSKPDGPLCWVISLAFGLICHDHNFEYNDTNSQTQWTSNQGAMHIQAGCNENPSLAQPAAKQGAMHSGQYVWTMHFKGIYQWEKRGGESNIIR